MPVAPEVASKLETSISALKKAFVQFESFLVKKPGNAIEGVDTKCSRDLSI